MQIFRTKFQLFLIRYCIYHFFVLSLHQLKQLKTNKTMRVFVDWDTDGYSVEELGLSTIVDIPTLNIDDVADHLSDKYGYCVSSFKIIELDSGSWHGEEAWVLYDDGHELAILIGGNTLEVALEVKERCDADMPSLYDNYVVWTDAEEWVKQQEFA